MQSQGSDLGSQSPRFKLFAGCACSHGCLVAVVTRPQPPPPRAFLPLGLLAVPSSSLSLKLWQKLCESRWRGCVGRGPGGGLEGPPPPPAVTAGDSPCEAPEGSALVAGRAKPGHVQPCDRSWEGLAPLESVRVNVGLPPKRLLPAPRCLLLGPQSLCGVPTY